MRAFGCYRALQIVGFSTSVDPFICKYAVSKNLLLVRTLFFSNRTCVIYRSSFFFNHGAVTRSRCGDGVSVVMTVPHRVELI